MLWKLGYIKVLKQNPRVPVTIFKFKRQKVFNKKVVMANCVVATHAQKRFTAHFDEGACCDRTPRTETKKRRPAFCARSSFGHMVRPREYL